MNKIKKMFLVGIFAIAVISTASARDKKSNFQIQECWDYIYFPDVPDENLQCQIIKRYVCFDKKAKKAYRFGVSSGNEALLDAFNTEALENTSDDVLKTLLQDISEGASYVERASAADGRFALLYLDHTKNLKNGLSKYSFAADIILTVTKKELTDADVVSLLTPKVSKKAGNIAKKMENVKSGDFDSDRIRPGYIFFNGNKIILTFINGETGSSDLVTDYINENENSFEYFKGVYMGQLFDLYTTELSVTYE